MMASAEVWRQRCRLGLFVFYGVAGVLHIAFPSPFLSITPNWVPDAPDVILLTGLCEIAGAIGLLVPRTRRYAGMALAFYAVLVFPANLKHAVDSLTAATVSPWQWAYHVIRLPLQPLLVWLAIFAGRRRFPR
ncbi:DoxX family protein [Rhizobium panacihumi]|jgi:uncharacterized membrane protein|uniref:DoxX family protein n=1 Tax=Rhizobium panacihumi TaxID=2008450 RepID=UPI003D7A301D